MTEIDWTTLRQGDVCSSIQPHTGGSAMDSSEPLMICAPLLTRSETDDIADSGGPDRILVSSTSGMGAVVSG